MPQPSRSRGASCSQDPEQLQLAELSCWPLLKYVDGWGANLSCATSLSSWTYLSLQHNLAYLAHVDFYSLTKLHVSVIWFICLYMLMTATSLWMNFRLQRALRRLGAKQTLQAHNTQPGVCSRFFLWHKGSCVGFWSKSSATFMCS